MTKNDPKKLKRIRNEAAVKLQADLKKAKGRPHQSKRRQPDAIRTAMTTIKEDAA